MNEGLYRATNRPDDIGGLPYSLGDIFRFIFHAACFETLEPCEKQSLKLSGAKSLKFRLAAPTSDRGKIWQNVAAYSHLKDKGNGGPKWTVDGTALEMKLGMEIYERDIRRKVEDGYHGGIIPIDVESGDWAIGDSVTVATDSLWIQHPDAVDMNSLRTGYGALPHFGSRPLLRVT